MKKNIKKKLVLTITTILVISAVLSFTGCAGESGITGFADSVTNETEVTTASEKETEKAKSAKTDSKANNKADSKADTKTGSKTDNKTDSKSENKTSDKDQTSVNKDETETAATQEAMTQSTQTAGTQTKTGQEQNRQDNTQEPQGGHNYNDEPEYREPKSEYKPETQSKTQTEQRSDAGKEKTPAEEKNPVPEPVVNTHEKETEHVHTWHPVYTTMLHLAEYDRKWIPDVPAHYEEQPIWDCHTVCNCGLDFDMAGMSNAEAAAHQKAHSMAHEKSNYGTQMVIVGYENVYVEESGHWEETLIHDDYEELVVDYYWCSCGAEKSAE